MQKRHFLIKDLEKKNTTPWGGGRRGEADLERTKWNFLSNIWLGFPDGEKRKNGGKAVMEQKEAKNFQNLWKAWILGLKKQNESYTNK